MFAPGLRDALQQDPSNIIECIVGSALAAVGLFVEHALPVHARAFRLDNPAIAYPYTLHDQVPAWLLFVLALLIPGALVLVLALEPAVRPDGSRSRTRHIAGFIMCIGVVAFVTGVLKHAIGNERPDFLSRCIPRKGTPTSVYVGLDVCTNTNTHMLREGVRSTPSGHSAYSFGGLGYLALMLLERLRERNRGLRGHPLAALACITPLALATYIAISRVVDYRHHFYDIAFGTAIGLIVAVNSFTYHSPEQQLQQQQQQQSHPSLADSLA